MMFTAYVIDKDGLALLWKLCGGDTEKIPGEISAEIADIFKVQERLEELGLLHISGEQADVERTMGFLVTSMINADKVISEKKKIIFYREKLIIAAEEDKLSKRKCKLTPIKDEKALAEFLAETEDGS